MSGLESSRLHPTAPAATKRSTTSAAGSPYPRSMSAVTGTATAAATRAMASNISLDGVASPSAYPSTSATAALLVAMAGNPAAATVRADAASQSSAG